ncbi:stage III sporulation protein AB [Oikeobacillus pervagus]|uniref:Stage III sporulation protein AB n=1 Tax=Oikeobacillus pervagus TaxID=1325931 RepID=A0AAJ1SW43_9BACI|nr:stage III sporulation protein SpoIIIAB [Oikeobacillus pervagus]MDQ0213835.1 stage III sporulation protein AB [Oikeobacillus pervagus]
MMKLVGAAIILITTTWIGFELARHLSERSKQLRLLKNGLQTLEAEIMYGHTPLHEASRKISNQLSVPISRLFHQFTHYLTTTETSVKAAWDMSLVDIKHQTALKTTDFEILQQFGETLGRHDRITQQKQILLALSYLEREEEYARENQLRYEKMIKSLSFLSGLLLIILLL